MIWVISCSYLGIPVGHVLNNTPRRKPSAVAKWRTTTGRSLSHGIDRYIDDCPYPFGVLLAKPQKIDFPDWHQRWEHLKLCVHLCLNKTNLRSSWTVKEVVCKFSSLLPVEVHHSSFPPCHWRSHQWSWFEQSYTETSLPIDSAHVLTEK